MQRSIYDICLLVPCYKNEEGLVRSINSVRYYPGRLMVLVVDDGSPVAVTKEAVSAQLEVDVNISVVRVSPNQGITAALNTGLEYANRHFATRFLARLDCGDTCSPERFYRQVDFFNKNDSIDMLGTWCYFKDFKEGNAYKYTTPTQHNAIRRSMYFRNVFIHPTVMWRSASLGGIRYPGRFPHAEDYGLFYDIMSAKTVAILNEYLVTCEINLRGLSFSNRFMQLRSRMKVIWAYGKNKPLVLAGTLKLLVLMAIPYRLAYQIKKKLFKV